VIRNAKTTGTGACDGCAQPAGIMLVYAQLDQPSPDANYTYPSLLRETGTSPYVNWQCNGNPKVLLDWDLGYYVHGWDFPGCATASRRSSWGQIKSLYR
jgi:hypothetical protein